MNLGRKFKEYFVPGRGKIKYLFPNIEVCLGGKKKRAKFIEVKSPKLHTKICPPWVTIAEIHCNLFCFLSNVNILLLGILFFLINRQQKMTVFVLLSPFFYRNKMKLKTYYIKMNLRKKIWTGCGGEKPKTCPQR